MHGRDSVVRGIVVCHFYGILLLFFVIFIRLLLLLANHGRLTGKGIWRLVIIIILLTLEMIIIDLYSIHLDQLLLGLGKPIVELLLASL